MTRTKVILFVLGILVTFITSLSFRPIPKTSEVESLVIRGLVTKISENATGDMVIRLRGIDKCFYINRGIESGLKIETLKTRLLHKEVVLKYPEYWTLLDPTSSTRHVSKIECQGRVIYSEY